MITTTKLRTQVDLCDARSGPEPWTQIGTCYGKSLRQFKFELHRSRDMIQVSVPIFGWQLAVFAKAIAEVDNVAVYRVPDDDPKLLSIERHRIGSMTLPGSHEELGKLFFGWGAEEAVEYAHRSVPVKGVIQGR